MKKKIDEIMKDYTSGKTSVKETNEELKKIGAAFYLNPDQNRTGNCLPNNCGLLDTGTGSLNRVEIKGGKIANGGVGESYALVWYKGKWYHVKPDGVTLCD